METDSEARALRLPPAISRSGEFCAALLSPVAALAFALAAWCLTFDLGLTGRFPVSEGPLAQWIVWTAIAIVLHLGALQLRRLARAGQTSQTERVTEALQAQAPGAGTEAVL